MNRIHFIWWGPNKGGICVDTPNALCAIAPDFEINFWCPWPGAGFNDSGLGQLNPMIRRRTIGPDFALFAGGLAAAVDGNAAEVLLKLHQYGANSAVKDLLSLLILEQEGGLYLDTTTALPADATRFRQAVTQLRQDPKVVILAEEGQVHRPYVITKKSAVWGDDNLLEGFPDYEVPIIDVWAMYGPPGHALMKGAIGSYLKRAQRLGITTGQLGALLTPTAAPEPTAPPEEVADYWMRRPDDRFVRNKIIGQLIIRSVYDGLFAISPTDHGAANAMTASYGWLSLETAAAARVLPDMGDLAKQYRNSWR